MAKNQNLELEISWSTTLKHVELNPAKEVSLRGTLNRWGMGKSAALEIKHPKADEQDLPVEATVPRRVLVVDDNKDARETMAALLQEFGHLVQIAHDGPCALDLALDFEPHVILLDLHMPGMSGFKVAQK
jgi:PleD family two-component response regulator